MAYPQSSIEDIVESERLMVAAARDRYGAFYTHARGCSVFMTLCIASVDPDRMMFGRLFSHMKKHHLLSLLSLVRLHKVQAMMNLRQVLEAGASAAFAIVHPEISHFADIDEYGFMDPSDALTKKRYVWLQKYHGRKSDWIKDAKKRINASAAHANIVSADSVFSINEEGNQIQTPYFDLEDDYTIKTDLWLAGIVAITLIDLFYDVNRTISTIEFRPDAPYQIGEMAHQSNNLLAELKTSQRFQAASRLALPVTP